MHPVTLEQLAADVRSLAIDFVTGEPAGVTRRALAVRDEAFALLEGHQWPGPGPLRRVPLGVLGHRRRGRLPRPRQRIAAFVLAAAFLTAGIALMQAEPVSAWTVENQDDRIVITSKRMHANTVYMTTILRLYENGNVEFRWEGRNSARIIKNYRTGADLKLPSGGIIRYDSERREIDGTWRSSLRAGDFQAHFWLKASWDNGGFQGNPEDYWGCAPAGCNSGEDM